MMPSLADFAGLFGHFLVLSLLSIGGAITTAPEMHRYLVLERGWLSDTQFTGSIALAQAAPGPNILFVAVLGWNVAGLLGAAVAMLGIMLPSTTLALGAARWGRTRRDTTAVRAFTAGMAPLTVGLLFSTGWVLTEPTRTHPTAVLLVIGSAALMLGTRLSPMWMIAAGAAAGLLGWV
ncbi:MAG TPA: chromate transporter [Burkholderiaceae bacterium]|nr:chromate transporter [Burkholderiaceae bacterium]